MGMGFLSAAVVLAFLALIFFSVLERDPTPSLSPMLPVLLLCVIGVPTCLVLSAIAFLWGWLA